MKHFVNITGKLFLFINLLVLIDFGFPYILSAVCIVRCRAIEASLGMPAGGRHPIMDGVESESREQLLMPNGPGDNNLFAGPAERTSAVAGRAVEEEEERAMLAEALAISARETALEEERRTKEDDELLRRILELSLVEK